MANSQNDAAPGEEGRVATTLFSDNKSITSLAQGPKSIIFGSCLNTDTHTDMYTLTYTHTHTHTHTLTHTHGCG